MNTHDIHMVRTHDTGAEEWFCPTCGRRFVVQWSPEYQYIVLETGETDAIHNMSRGAMVFTPGSTEIRAEHLQPWLEFLNTMDLEARLGEKDHEN